MLTGNGPNDIDFGEEPLGANGYVVRLDNQGDLVWQVPLLATEVDGPGVTPLAVGVGPDGEVVVVAGRFSVDVRVGEHFVQGGADGVVAKLDQDGISQWLVRAEGERTGVFSVKGDVKIDQRGAIFVAAPFGYSGCLGLQLPAVGEPVVVAALNSDGTPPWCVGAADQAESIALRPAGGVVVALGQQVREYDSDGIRRRVLHTEEIVEAAEVDVAGGTFLGGRFEGDFALQGACVSGSGGFDAFVARLSEKDW